MLKLEDLKPSAVIQGILPSNAVTVISVTWFGSDALELTYKDPQGRPANQLLYRSDESRLALVEQGRPWSFDGDGAFFRLVSEAQRIRLAHLFDPVLAVHTSMVEPLPHQITAVYEYMLPRQPLRFLLADDPGAGKTIMAGLLIKELITRGDLQRCMVVCPGNLVEQWQDELYQRFGLPFEIMTREKIESSKSGNWFLENDLVIARLDMLSRNEELKEKLKIPEAAWDLVVCDEAHKMSASFFGGEINYTKRFQLGRLLSNLTRHFLLMTATPHNGKEADFQLFLSLLDQDRFEGKFREGVHTTDVSDLMRRMIKEKLLTFEGKPLFPDRIASTVPYKLSKQEMELYEQVTTYVREEFNRAEALQNEQHKRTVGFALMVLQRRLASSPEAIYQSLKRRRERLELKLEEAKRSLQVVTKGPISDNDLDLDDLDDAPDAEIEAIETEVLDEATASRNIMELETEIVTLKHLETRALLLHRNGTDTKWRELAGLLGAILAPDSDQAIRSKSEQGPTFKASPNQKIVIFTEHRDTLNYLYRRITTFLGRSDAVVTIHGGMGREERLRAQEAFKYQKEVTVLIATDAAGEGINLQRAHLMVNYDLPWNPNRIEQRFGRIHRIGQTEVCFLWNLVATDTREGDVYKTLLDKLNEAKNALGGQVFDVLGKLQFEGKSLRDLLLDAIRYGEQPEVRDKLNQVVDKAFDPSKLSELLEEKSLVHNVMDISKVQKIREDMERAEARRLQPHYIESFFKEAFRIHGGTFYNREPGRYEITHVPANIRHRDQYMRVRSPILERYERITFQKDLITLKDAPLAAFACPGMPLLDAVIDLTLEQHGELLKRGTILVDDKDMGTEPRMFFYLEHAIQDASRTRSGERRIISKRVLYIEMNASRETWHIHYAPYLDYRPLSPYEPSPDRILSQPECSWITRDLEQSAKIYAVTKVAPEHLEEVRSARLALIEKTRVAVKDRLTKEINYWDRRAQELKEQERAGKPNARLNWKEAMNRADKLQERLKKRFIELDLEADISSLPPHVQGGFLVVPLGLLQKIEGKQPLVPTYARDTQENAARARAIVMEIERRLGYEPVDVETQKLGYDIESRIPGTGQLRFIEVKGRVSGATTITVTRNEVLYSLNKPDQYILAIVEFLEDGNHRVHYVRRPFLKEPDFGVVSQNYDFAQLLAKAEKPS
ncbi:MAG TPA: helicase-related protein [Treponema sp.]|nr:helicase-related protein [Treponema sp.]HPC72351.1 helicase-related protein [Treponema sp.]HRS04651.1 helicase-related protein [Treponema sp.]HRU29526.1 helicase-related protein [Treponema sp.]